MRQFFELIEQDESNLFDILASKNFNPFGFDICGIFNTTSKGETNRLGRSFAQVVRPALVAAKKPSEVIRCGIIGDMGLGKTTLADGIVQGLTFGHDQRKEEIGSKNDRIYINKTGLIRYYDAICTMSNIDDDYDPLTKEQHVYRDQGGIDLIEHPVLETVSLDYAWCATELGKNQIRWQLYARPKVSRTKEMQEFLQCHRDL